MFLFRLLSVTLFLTRVSVKGLDSLRRYGNHVEIDGVGQLTIISRTKCIFG